MDFRNRLLATLRAIQPILDEPGILVAGSEVPNLLQPGVQATLVVSEDVDIAVPVQQHRTLDGALGTRRGAVSAVLHERARRMRERALIRAWEYRQRKHSKGVWFRMRRALVDAASAWVITDADADRLEAAGCVPLRVGQELFPPKRIFLSMSFGSPSSHRVAH